MSFTSLSWSTDSSTQSRWYPNSFQKYGPHSNNTEANTKTEPQNPPRLLLAGLLVSSYISASSIPNAILAQVLSSNLRVHIVSVEWNARTLGIGADRADISLEYWISRRSDAKYWATYNSIPACVHPIVSRYKPLTENIQARMTGVVELQVKKYCSLDTVLGYYTLYWTIVEK
ncbi:hypothetical protein BDP27DRAFT_1403727 [Rhodocollybia butyracea]|uniref:Uncharacterized protein n=1 Tax=Rhodocollybia butyracea TaxID=206335 RepID=A0A9P5PTA2_9AGAR|nr:hypothetical protein BDP27DRAFT_1403727 [Rhodocollybia butyracea]